MKQLLSVIAVAVISGGLQAQAITVTPEDEGRISRPTSTATENERDLYLIQTFIEDLERERDFSTLARIAEAKATCAYSFFNARDNAQWQRIALRAIERTIRQGQYRQRLSRRMAAGEVERVLGELRSAGALHVTLEGPDIKWTDNPEIQQECNQARTRVLNAYTNRPLG